MMLVVVFGFKNLSEEKIEPLPNHKLLNQKISFNKAVAVSIKDGTIGGPKECTKLCQLSGGVNRSISDLQGLGTIWKIPMEYINQDRVFVVNAAYLDKTLSLDAGPLEILILQDIRNGEKYKITAHQFEFYPTMNIYADQISSKHLFEVAEKNGNTIKIMVNLKSNDVTLSDNESTRLQQVATVQDEFINKLPTYFTGKNLTKDKYQLSISVDVTTNDLAYLISSKVPLNIEGLSEYKIN